LPPSPRGRAMGVDGDRSLSTRATAQPQGTPNITLPKELRDFLTSGAKELARPGRRALPGREPAASRTPDDKLPPPATKLKTARKTSFSTTKTRSEPAVPQAKAAPRVPRELQDYLTAGTSELLGSRKRTIRPLARFGIDDEESVRRTKARATPAQKETKEPQRSASSKVILDAPATVDEKRVPDADGKPSNGPAAEQQPANMAPSTTATPAVRAQRAASAPVDDRTYAVGVGIPLPDHWPTPLLPSGVILDKTPPAIAPLIVAPLDSSSDEPKLPEPKTPTMSAARKKGSTRSRRCACGTTDKTKWTVQCAECERVMHGQCVGADAALYGLEQAKPKRKRGEPPRWYCRGCAARRKRQSREQAEFGWTDRSERYCICNSPWDGRDFMIACDICTVWYHGACVGLSVPTVNAGTEAAFRRYVCPRCTVSSDLGGKQLSNARATVEQGLDPSHTFEASGNKALAAGPATPVLLSSSTTSDDSSTSNSPSVSRQVTLNACSSAPMMALPSAHKSWADGSSALAWLVEAASAMRPSSVGNTPTSKTTTTGLPMPGSTPHRTTARRHTLARVGLLDVLTDDCVTAILSHLPISSLLLCAVPLSHRVADLAEPLFRKECVARGWKLQRRLASAPCPWRRMLRTRSCAVCLSHVAPFVVRRPPSTAAVFRLCRTCARRSDVQEQCHWHSLEVESIGEKGQPLFSRQFHTPLFGRADGFSQRSIRQG